jgi:hypothetical protein
MSRRRWRRRSGSDEAEVLEDLGVVVAADRDHVGAPPRPLGDEIDHADRSPRRLRGKGVLAYPPAGLTQLAGEVSPRLGEGRRARRPRTEADQPLDVVERASAVEVAGGEGRGGRQAQQAQDGHRPARMTAPGHAGTTPLAA